MENSENILQKADPVLNAPIQPIQWRQTQELGYIHDDTGTKSVVVAPVCFACGADNATLHCSRCHVATYCGKECQVRDWKTTSGGGSHKLACDGLARVGYKMNFENDDAKKKEARNQIFGRIRFYACPYAVTKASELGRGFLFIQSESTLATMSLSTPKNSYGQSTGIRSLLIHFLTLGEYDQEVCRDDFEMAAVRTDLQKEVQQYDVEKEVVVLMRFRCGHVALGTALLVPDYRICQQLGRDYFGSGSAGALQLNLDDL